MSEQTVILPESAKEEKKAAAKPATAKKGKQAVAIVAGVAAGAGAIAIDSYAGNEEKTADAQVDENAEVNDSTATANDSTAANTPETVANETVADTTANHVQTIAPGTPAPEAHPDSTAVTMIPDDIMVVNAPDDMTFDEAFHAVRNELGPGTLFEWHGNLYHTYHPDEYASLPQEIKVAYETLWVAQNSGLEVVPETEGAYVVYDVDVTGEGPSNEAIATDSAPVDEIPTDTASTNDPDYLAYANDPITEDEFDNHYEGAEDLMNPEDLA